jgi:hypothetical protein
MSYSLLIRSTVSSSDVLQVTNHDACNRSRAIYKLRKGEERQGPGLKHGSRDEVLRDLRTGSTSSSSGLTVKLGRITLDLVKVQLK